MRIYHGTSLENACKILSEPIWNTPIELYLKGVAEFRKLGYKTQYEPIPADATFIHFSTSKRHALSYAFKHERPVLLSYKADDVTEKCIDFQMHDIPTADVVAVKVNYKDVDWMDRISLNTNALIINSVYNTKGKYYTTRGFECIIIGDSRKASQTACRIVKCF